MKNKNRFFFFFLTIKGAGEVANSLLARALWDQGKARDDVGKKIHILLLGALKLIETQGGRCKLHGGADQSGANCRSQVQHH